MIENRLNGLHGIMVLHVMVIVGKGYAEKNVIWKEWVVMEWK